MNGGRGNIFWPAKKSGPWVRKGGGGGDGGPGGPGPKKSLSGTGAVKKRRSRLHRSRKVKKDPFQSEGKNDLEAQGEKEEPSFDAHGGP